MLAALTLSSALAGPWVRDAGHAYVKAGTSHFTASDFIQPEGEMLKDPSFRSDRASVYGEVGIGKQVQVVFDTPVVRAQNTVAGDPFTTTRLGDARIGFEWGGMLDQTPVSFQALAKVPLYSNGNTRGGDSGRFPDVGDGQVDLNATFAVGRGLSVGSVRGWVAAELGYRARTEIFLGDPTTNRRFVDGVPFNAQLGWSPQFKDRDAGWLFVSASGIKNLAVEETTQEFAQIEAGGAVRIAKGFAVEAGAAQIVWARNSNRGSALNLGVSWSR